MLPIYNYDFDRLEKMSDFEIRQILYRAIEQRCIERSIPDTCEFFAFPEDDENLLDEFIIVDTERAEVLEQEAIEVMTGDLYKDQSIPSDTMAVINYLCERANQ